jgi:hypothetical protein
MRLDEVMPRICKAAAQAVYRYIEVSLDPCDEPPEYFLSSFVFDKLGSEYTMALETKTKKLQEWNEEIHKMLGKPPPQPEHQKAIEKAVEQLPNKRVDLILFDNPPNMEWSFAGLIEFKLWNEGEDRAKVLKLLDGLDTCPAGAVCCLTNAYCDDAYMQALKREAELEDRFFCHNVPEMPSWRSPQKSRYAVYARVFSRGARVRNALYGGDASQV